MPKLPQWYLRVPEILCQLRAAEAPPFLDRPAIEKLFRVSRRQAIRLLGSAQGYQVGRTFLVERQTLIQSLEELEKSGAAPQARARKRSVVNALNEVANYSVAQSVTIPASADPLRRGRPAGIPDAIELIAPGKLQISYQGAEDLLARIVELVTAAANDFPCFRKFYEGRE
jgi:hypothetical protein